MKIDAEKLAEDVASYINNEVDSVIVLRLLSIIKELGGALEYLMDYEYHDAMERARYALKLIEPLKPLFKEQPHE